jgi:ParB family chromosome partitioning protein
LQASIKAKGQLLPIRVRKDAANHEQFVILSGHRRYAAVTKLGLPTIKAIVVDGPLTESDILEEQIAENKHRSNLKPLEEASAFRKYLDLKQCSASEAAKALAISPANFSKMLKLLDLPESFRAAVDTGTIPVETAYHLARQPDSTERDALFQQAIQGKLSRDQAIRATRMSPTKDANAPSLSRASFTLPEQKLLTLSGGIDTIDALISQLEFLLRHARKALQKGWDISTFSKVLRDQAKSDSTPAS